MYCPNCAAPIDGVKFCRSCGANVSLVPQALTGKLPDEVGEKDKRRGKHGHRRDRMMSRHGGKKPASIERAASNFFTGVGFILASVLVLRFFPGGFTWGWSLLIPAFACIGEGVGQYLRLKEQQREQQQFNPAVGPQINYQTPMQSAPRPAELSVPTTSELTPPSSVAEHTTKHLDSSRGRE